jgi:polyhydroxyalkanoate synthesis regulator phasin
MAEKRMLIVPAEVLKKIDDNRGDLSQAEFISFLIDNQLKGDGTQKKQANKDELVSLIESQLKEASKKQHFVTREEMETFELDIKSLLKSCLDFFVSYGLELGKQSPKTELEELNSKLEELESDLGSEENHPGSEGESKEARIKWK